MKGDCVKREKLIRLGIALDYPVQWKFERVLRDLIQNFYDSIGPDRFGKAFHYSYDCDQSGRYLVKMETEGRPFHYEWLLYIGGSTKTDSPGTYIGKYGEGFKICMLCLLQMGIKDIEMHSRDWILRPCTYEEIIDDTSVSMLGYKLAYCRDDNVTRLSIKGIHCSYYYILNEALLHFFYPGNRLFGEKLGEGICRRLKYKSGNAYCIYKSNGYLVPNRDNGVCRGILFINNLARGRLPFPVFVNLTGSTLDLCDSRKRDVLDRFRVWKNMYILSLWMSPEDSLKLLMLLKDYWNDVPKSQYDTRTWYYLICQLVRNVAESENTTAQFLEKNLHLAYLERKSSDQKRNSLIERASVWARDNNTGKKVNPVFRFLGARSLLEEFQKTEFSGLRPPTEPERIMAALLTQVYLEIIPPRMQVEVPDILIAGKEEADIDPLCFADKHFDQKNRKQYQKYRLRYIILREEEFTAESYEAALTRFLDGIFHAFGSSRSNRMNVLYTYLGAMLIEHANTITQNRKRWNQYALDLSRPGIKTRPNLSVNA